MGEGRRCTEPWDWGFHKTIAVLTICLAIEVQTTTQMSINNAIVIKQRDEIDVRLVIFKWTDGQNCP